MHFCSKKCYKMHCFHNFTKRPNPLHQYHLS